jgi:hypothetical protein
MAVGLCGHIEGICVNCVEDRLLSIPMVGGLDTSAMGLDDDGPYIGGWDDSEMMDHGGNDDAG